jgi:hypothetical protein
MIIIFQITIFSRWFRLPSLQFLFAYLRVLWRNWGDIFWSGLLFIFRSPILSVFNIFFFKKITTGSEPLNFIGFRFFSLRIALRSSVSYLFSNPKEKLNSFRNLILFLNYLWCYLRSKIFFSQFVIILFSIIFNWGIVGRTFLIRISFKWDVLFFCHFDNFLI